jgi:hypothetical protein
MRPDVSIVVPAYNVSTYLGAALESALAQKGVAVEVIVVDDGSTDGTAEVIAGFAGDTRLRVISQANAGLPAARNVGIAAAAGRYIGFLDGDDVWLENKAERHAALLDADPGIDLTYSWWREIDDYGRPFKARDAAKPVEKIAMGLSLEGLVIENFAGNGSTVVCRAEALARTGGFDPEMRKSCEDLDAWLRLAVLRNANIALVPEVLTLYRHRLGQMTRDWGRMLDGWETAIAKAKQMEPDRIAQVERRGRAEVLRFMAYTAYEAGNHAAARALVWRAWKEAPVPLLRDRLCWMVTCASAAEAVMPTRTHRRVEAWIKLRRRGSVPDPRLNAHP